MHMTKFYKDISLANMNYYMSLFCILIQKPTPPSLMERIQTDLLWRGAKCQPAQGVQTWRVQNWLCVLLSIGPDQEQKAWPKSRRAQLQGAARLWLQEVGPRESVNTSRRCGPLGEKARLGLRVLWELGIGQPFSPSTGQTPRKAPDLTPWQFPSSLHTPLPSSSLDSFLPRLLNPQAEEVVCSHAGHFPSPPPCQLTGSLCPAFQANIRYHSTLIPHDHSKPRSLLLSFL